MMPPALGPFQAWTEVMVILSHSTGSEGLLRQ